jgi:hypothetical protein
MFCFFHGKIKYLVWKRTVNLHILVAFSDSVFGPEPVGEGGEGVVPHPRRVIVILLHQFPAEKIT